MFRIPVNSVISKSRLISQFFLGLFAIWIIMSSTRRRAITEKSPSFSTGNVEGSQNILLEIFNSHPIAKFDGSPYFCISRCEVGTAIFTIFSRSSRRAIYSCAIHVTVGCTLYIGWWWWLWVLRISFSERRIFCRPRAWCSGFTDYFRL